MTLAPKPPVKMESRDERITVRMTPTERARWQDAARKFGEEESRYFRRCAAIGRNVLESGAFAQPTAG